MRDAWQLWRKSSELLDNVIENVDNIVANEKTIAAGINKEPETEVKESVRVSKIFWLSDQAWLRLFLYDNFILPANRNAFSVDVSQFADIQYTEYHASENGHYDWHIDTFWTSECPFDRKLSLTLQLSDSDEYEGGDFEFMDVPNPSDIRKKGTVLVFPSYLRHRVTPVTKGVRRSLVAWFEGPRWR